MHADPVGGSAYWIARFRDLGLRSEAIAGWADLPRLGAMDLDALARRDIADLVPRRLHHRLPECRIVETGGTSGAPRYAVWRDDEFHAAFVAPFLAAALRCGFPSGGRWLFVGPSGPHIIGQAAAACARACGCPAPHAVDFDPRWAKTLPDGSLARERYLAHVAGQARRVLATQAVTVLFTTPPVALALAADLPVAVRTAIRGLHLGGLPATPDLYARLAEVFPQAVTLAGYGNSLLGMAPELARCEGRPVYAPLAGGPVLELLGDDGDLAGRAAPGRRGRVLGHRLDEMTLLLNVVERDTARAAALPAGAEGFAGPALEDPQPLSGPARPTGLY